MQTGGGRGQSGISNTNLGVAVGVSLAVFLIAVVIIAVIMVIVVKRRRTNRRGEYVLTVVAGKPLVSSKNYGLTCWGGGGSDMPFAEK